MLPISSISYQHIMIKVITIWAKLPTFSRRLELLSFSNLYYLEELLIFSNPQTRIYDWKLSQLESYQYWQLVTNILLIWYQQFGSSYQYIEK